ncbi:hypothetical protein Unana1_07878 [Umbelopsis nana]
MMKAIVIEKHGGPEELHYIDFAKPVPQEGQILVKNHYSGVNYLDVYHRTGFYPTPTPLIPGCEAAGEVVQVGPGVEEYKVGDRVAWTNWTKDVGSYAQYTAVPVMSANKIPDNVSFDQAAAIVVTGLTAWTMLRSGCNIQKGEVVLIHAAAGGVGITLVQMAKILGATVIGTVSSKEKEDLAKEFGADYVINYSHEDVVTRVQEITNGLGCHAVLDGVGASTFDASIKSTRRCGIFVSFGDASGSIPPIDSSALSANNIKFLKSGVYGYLVTKEEKEKWWGELFQLMAEKKLKLKIFKLYELENAKDAHADLEDRKTVGKLLLKI